MKLKNLVTFTLGVTFGVLVTIAKLYYDVLSKPVEPTLGTTDDSLLINDMWIRIIWNPPVKTELSTSLDKTQPVKVERVNKQRYADLQDTSGGEIPPGATYIIGEDNEVGVWEFEEWAKEAE